MEITALVSFGALLVAWIVAPSSSTVAARIAPSVLQADIRSITGADALPEVPSTP
ncbi:hypothetical protein BH23CHL9_BH23CHL9_01250 [soil metagenome]